jgi:hypothetical protein
MQGRWEIKYHPWTKMTTKIHAASVLGASGSMVSVCSPGGAAVNMLQELTIPGSTPLAKARNLMTSKHDSYK